MTDLPLVYGPQATLGPTRLALEYRLTAVADRIVVEATPIIIVEPLPPVSRWRRWLDWLYNAALYWVYGH